MRRPVRLAVAALGIAAAVYGAARMTGGWLGVPAHHGTFRIQEGEYARNDYFGGGWGRWMTIEVRGVGLIAAGLALAAFALWPRRVPAPPSIPVQYRERG